MTSRPGLVVAAMALCATVGVGAQQAMTAPVTAPAGSIARGAVIAVDPNSPRMTKGEASLSGRVVDAAGDAPVAGAMVTLAPGGAQPASVTTDAQGFFIFPDLPAGHFGLIATRDGYLPGAFGRLRPFGPTQSLDLVERERRTDVTLRVWRQAVANGQVVDDTNQPVRGASVRALERATTGGGTRWTLGPAATTDERGFYRIPALTPGDYMLAIPRAAARAAYETVFYIAATSPSAALVLPMQSGEERNGLDFTLQPSAAGTRVSGVLTGTDGAPVPRMRVTLTPAQLTDLTLPIENTATTTDDQGRFQFDRVTPGDYVVRALTFVTAADLASPRAPLTAVDRMLPVVGQPVRWATTQIAVDDRELTGVAMTLRAGLSVSGWVRLEGGAAADVDLTKLDVYLVPAEGRPAELPSRGAIAADGRFTTAGLLPGKYYVRVAGGTRTWTVKSAMFDGRDVSDVALDLSDDDVKDVVITYTNRPSTLSGLVLNSRGVPDPRASVVIFPADPALWPAAGGASRRFYQLRVTPAGDYSARNLPTGQYLVAAVPDEISGGWTEPAFLEAIARLARRVTIADGAAVTQELRTLTIR